MGVLKTGARRQARELALKALYMYDIQGNPDDETLRRFWSESPSKKEVRIRAREMVARIVENVDMLDARIEAASDNWRIGRMSRVDKNVLRVAVCEILMDDDIPPQVSIDEAIEIAKRYGDTHSPAFVNGILDRVLKEVVSDAS